MENEKRLIELDHALQAVAEQYTTDTTERELNMFCDIRQRLRTLPTVDAVEVPCRCCDCYYLLNSINSFGVYFFCGHRNGLKNLHNTEKDFCPYGKVRYEDGK